ncbi:DUF6783 domain-containing protein [Lachnospiraceae bacterium 45-P1]
MSFLRNKKHFVLRTALRRKGRCRCSDLPWAENPARQDSFSFHHRQAAYLYAKSVFAPAFMPRACLKIYSHHLHAPLCGKFGPHSVNVAHYASHIRPQFPTNCDAQLPESNFQTHSRDQQVVSPFPGQTACWSPFFPLIFPMTAFRFLQPLHTG